LHGNFTKEICKVTNQEGTTGFSVSGSPSVIETPMDEEIGIFTMIAKDEYRNDVSDAFLVEEPQLITALNDLLALRSARRVSPNDSSTLPGIAAGGVTASKLVVQLPLDDRRTIIT
jgi:hypothetical protein